MIVQRAQLSVQMMKARNDIRDDIESAADSFAMRTDYEKFGDDAGKMVTQLHDKYFGLYGGNASLWSTVKPMLEYQANHFQRAVIMKGLGLMVDDGRAELDRSEDKAAKDWALADGKEEKEFLPMAAVTAAAMEPAAMPTGPPATAAPTAAPARG